ncbi:MAG TPA: protein kinase [Gemmatimonadaceae bacterium]|nr:protein kinase [Gemmatimonadaceae bacterium]
MGRSGALRADSLPRQRWAALNADYELVGELGRGGMADVYLARDRRTGANLAVKVIQARTSDDEESLARFAREARTTGHLEHPNIVSIIATRELEDGSLALVMPYVPGETLRDLVRRRGALANNEVEQILRDVGNALTAAHAAGIVHRDVKPENIFIHQEDGRALLSDFGIARAIDSETVVTKTGMSIGTPAYMSPEQIDGRHVDGQSDLFSLGLVGWEMLSGMRPWAGESLYSVIYKQINEELPPVASLNREVPSNLELAIEGALIKDRNARWSSVQDMLAQLDHRDGALPTDRGALVAERVRARQAKDVAAQGAGVTAVFARPVLTPPVEPNESVELSAEDLALVRPRRLRASTLLPVAAAIALIVALAMRETGTLPSLAANDKPLIENGQPLVENERDGAVGSGVAPEASATPLGTSDSIDITTSGDSATASAEATADTSQAAGSVSSEQVATPESLAGAFSDRDVPAIVTPPAELPGASTPPASTAPTPSVSPPPLRSSATPPPSPVARTVAAGGMHSCAVAANGELFCWGSNDRGQLGSGATTRQADPTRVATDVRFRSVSAGVAHSCGLATSGDAYCWGANDKGQLGDGSTTPRPTPVAVSGGRSYRVIRSGMAHTCALTTGGEVYCWGTNAVGQLGNGSTSSSARPVRVLAPGRFVALDVGWNHACAITDDRKLLCWGQNAAGQLGDGSTTNHYAPTAVMANGPFEAVATGGTHSCALVSGGEAYCWGRNSGGQLGDGTTDDRFVPTRVSTQLAFQSITAGSVHTCALTSSGQAYCWGRNSYGQLGDGNTSMSPAPTRVAGGHGFSTLDATGAHTCALTSSGESFCWGYNVEGQLGDRTRAHRARPVYVDKPSG